LIKEGRYCDVFDLDTKHVITSFFEVDQDDDAGNVTVTIEDGVGYVYIHEFEMKVELHQAITARVVKMSGQGFDPQPMINFISNLYSNPSKVAVDELFLFIEQSELPITEDGCFIAYKIVREDYLDIYSGKMDNSIGNTLSMPRNMVDDNRNNTCSQGLHFCSRSYLRHYGSSSRGVDRCLLVKVNPMDVVSIPSDYNNAKGRTWTYEVVGEIDGNWRETLPTEDYTTASVVNNAGQTYYAPFDEDEYDTPEEDLEDDYLEDLESATDEETEEELYREGYLSGYRDGSIKAHANAVYTGSYEEGYELGYKNGKNHTRKLYK
jgi:uncharacterized protein YnzC (UPF0291/DUF896 family)